MSSPRVESFRVTELNSHTDQTRREILTALLVSTPGHPSNG